MSEPGRILLAAAGLAVVVLGCVAQARALSPARETNGRIVFRRYLDVGRTTGAIFTVNPNGKHVVRVTHAGAGVNDTEPDWSADGSRFDSPKGYFLALGDSITYGFQGWKFLAGLPATAFDTG
jgi:hypothetical protein